MSREWNLVFCCFNTSRFVCTQLEAVHTMQPYHTELQVYCERHTTVGYLHWGVFCLFLPTHRGIWHCVQGSADWNEGRPISKNCGSENFERLANLTGIRSKTNRVFRVIKMDFAQWYTWQWTQIRAYSKMQSRRSRGHAIIPVHDQNKFILWGLPPSPV